MEITLEVLDQGQQKIEKALYGLKHKVAEIKQDIINSSLKITQWGVDLFIGAVVTLTSGNGIYIALTYVRNTINDWRLMCNPAGYSVKYR